MDPRRSRNQSRDHDGRMSAQLRHVVLNESGWQGEARTVEHRGVFGQQVFRGHELDSANKHELDADGWRPGCQGCRDDNVRVQDDPEAHGRRGFDRWRRRTAATSRFTSLSLSRSSLRRFAAALDLREGFRRVPGPLEIVRNRDEASPCGSLPPPAPPARPGRPLERFPLLSHEVVAGPALPARTLIFDCERLEDQGGSGPRRLGGR